MKTLAPIAATRAESVYRRIRTEILSGELLPGSKLRAEVLAARLGTSASPMREALSRLAGEALVRAEGQRGYWVADISIKEFKEITHLRLQLETQALRDSVVHGDLAWEGRVVAAFHRLSKVETLLGPSNQEIQSNWELENRLYHTELISCCPSGWILRITEMLYDHSARYRRPAILNRPISPKVIQAEHRQIMDAALARDPERAAVALAQHILNAATNVECALHEERTSTLQFRDIAEI